MSTFHFKQFSIAQNLCAMKVGTDGVLLGAWTKSVNGNILDIGSGTGLIAIMMAQRNPTSTIDAIDIDQTAFQQTVVNSTACQWNNRIHAFHVSSQNFSPQKKYDLIVSNPPYFNNSYKSANPSKNTARHTDTLTFDELLKTIARLLSKTGIFSVILPHNAAEKLIELAKSNQLHLNRSCEVKPNFTKPAKRMLMEFSFHEEIFKKETLIIETNQRHIYTQEYRNLTKDFYLAF